MRNPSPILATSRHIVRRSGESTFAVPPEFVGHSSQFRRWTVVGEDAPAVHTRFGVCALDPGGSVAAHVHSFEETFHVVDGQAELATPDGSFALRAGDYGLIPVGLPHAWRNQSHALARWAEMNAPQPRARLAYDTFFVPERPWMPPIAIDVRDPRIRSFGHIEPSNMDVSRQTQDQLAVSASMRTALLVYSGITVKMMVDSDLGAQLSTMFMVQYDPNGVAGHHDHPFEETYLILEETVDAFFDGEAYHLTAGDTAFSGVGCVHRFSNPANSTVRWVETQAPAPPPRHSYRFARDWEYLQSQLEATRQ